MSLTYNPADHIRKRLKQLAPIDSVNDCECGYTTKCACCEKRIDRVPMNEYRLCYKCGFFIGQLMGD